MLAMVVWTVGGTAQSPTARPTTAKPVAFATTFSAISHLVELADGRVLLHDPVEQQLGITNLQDGSFAELARQGQGPMEYRSVGAMHRCRRFDPDLGSAQQPHRCRDLEWVTRWYMER